MHRGLAGPLEDRRRCTPGRGDSSDGDLFFFSDVFIFSRECLDVFCTRSTNDVIRRRMSNSMLHKVPLGAPFVLLLQLRYRLPFLNNDDATPLDTDLQRRRSMPAVDTVTCSQMCRVSCDGSCRDTGSRLGGRDVREVVVAGRSEAVVHSATGADRECECCESEETRLKRGGRCGKEESEAEG
jgi:hypothetical protein